MVFFCAELMSICAQLMNHHFQVADLLDMVLDSFIKRSVTGGLGSIQAEIMADTAVALTSANVQLVSRKVIGRLCRVRFFPFQPFLFWIPVNRYFCKQ